MQFQLEPRIIAELFSKRRQNLRPTRRWAISRIRHSSRRVTVPSLPAGAIGSSNATQRSASFQKSVGGR